MHGFNTILKVTVTTIRFIVFVFLITTKVVGFIITSFTLPEPLVFVDSLDVSDEVIFARHHNIALRTCEALLLKMFSF